MRKEFRSSGRAAEDVAGKLTGPAGRVCPAQFNKEGN